MAPMSNLEQLHTLDLLSFTLNHDYKSSGPSRLYLDRANGEVGVVAYEAPAVLTMAQYPDDEALCFQLKAACAASWRSKCKKVSLLFQHMQLDLDFASADMARAFLNVVEDVAMGAGNHYFYTYEVPSGVPFVRADFDMAKLGYVSRAPRNWAMVPADSDWPRLRKTGDWSDFTILAQGRKFPVHRVKLCKESQYFKAVCSGGFAESAMRMIELPESAEVVGALLDELYDTYNSTTGSLFTNFALCREIEKETNMTKLLDLFIACDKYNLEKVKRKVSIAIIDRLPFIKDSLMLVDLAANMFHEQFPHVDGGLRQAVIVKIEARLSAIIEDEAAWDEMIGNKSVLKALHVYQCQIRDDAEDCGAG